MQDRERIFNKFIRIIRVRQKRSCDGNRPLNYKGAISSSIAIARCMTSYLNGEPRNAADIFQACSSSVESSLYN